MIKISQRYPSFFENAHQLSCGDYPKIISLIRQTKTILHGIFIGDRGINKLSNEGSHVIRLILYVEISMPEEKKSRLTF